MRCWDARKHVSEYLDGTLEAATANLVAAHLEVCPTCPPLYAALVNAHEQFGALRDPDEVIPQDLDQRVRSVLS